MTNFINSKLRINSRKSEIADKFIFDATWKAGSFCT